MLLAGLPAEKAGSEGVVAGRDMKPDPRVYRTGWFDSRHLLHTVRLGQGWIPNLALIVSMGLPEARPALAWEGGPGRAGIGQGELILCAGEMITEESAIESPKPPREIRSNCFTSRPAAPLSH
jgi:hypothetical protein